MINVESEYRKWCKKTRRNGGIITGESLREFFEEFQKLLDKVIDEEKIKASIKSGKENDF